MSEIISLDSLHPPLATAGSAGERALIRIAPLDPHVARMLRLAYDDPVALDGREYAYKVTGIWRGARRDVDGSGLKLADFMKLLGKAGAKFKYNARAGGTLSLEIYRQLENPPDGKFPPGTQRGTFTVRLKGISATDLDRSRKKAEFLINAQGVTIR